MFKYLLSAQRYRGRDIVYMVGLKKYQTVKDINPRRGDLWM